MFWRARSAATLWAMCSKSSSLRTTCHPPPRIDEMGEAGVLEVVDQGLPAGHAGSPPYLHTRSQSVSSGIAPSRWRCSSTLGAGERFLAIAGELMQCVEQPIYLSLGRVVEETDPNQSTVGAAQGTHHLDRVVVAVGDKDPLVS